jgi:hypothetical protein
MNYILVDGEPREEPDIIRWATWFKEIGTGRQLARDDVAGAMVSTVFLGIDHGWGGVVQLWETMVFGGALEGEQVRYATRAEALAGHSEMVARVLDADRLPRASDKEADPPTDPATPETKEG